MALEDVPPPGFPEREPADNTPSLAAGLTFFSSTARSQLCLAVKTRDSSMLPPLPVFLLVSI